MVKMGFLPDNYSVFEAYQFVAEEKKEKDIEKKDDREFLIDVICGVSGVKRR